MCTVTAEGDRTVLKIVTSPVRIAAAADLVKVALPFLLRQIRVTQSAAGACSLLK